MDTPRSSFHPVMPDMSAFDLARWQVNEVLYARKVDTTEGPGFAVYAADGTPLFTTPTMAQVLVAAQDNEMKLASVH